MLERFGGFVAPSALTSLLCRSHTPPPALSTEGLPARRRERKPTRGCCFSKGPGGSWAAHQRGFLAKSPGPWVCDQTEAAVLLSPWTPTTDTSSERTSDRAPSQGRAVTEGVDMSDSEALPTCPARLPVEGLAWPSPSGREEGAVAQREGPARGAAPAWVPRGAQVPGALVWRHWSPSTPRPSQPWRVPPAAQTTGPGNGASSEHSSCVEDRRPGRVGA